MVEVGKDVVAERRRNEARSGRWKESDLTKARADPATRVDGIIAESGRCWSHVKAPWIGTKAQRKGGEFGATVDISGQSNEQEEAGELIVGG